MHQRSADSWIWPCANRRTNGHNDAWTNTRTLLRKSCFYHHLEIRPLNLTDEKRMASASALTSEQSSPFSHALSYWTLAAAIIFSSVTTNSSNCARCSFIFRGGEHYRTSVDMVRREPSSQYLKKNSRMLMRSLQNASRLVPSLFWKII